MKRAAITLFMFIALLLPALAKGIKTETVKLPTLQCGMCEQKIETAMKDLKGIKSFDVDVEKLNATVEYDSDVLTMEKIEKAIAAVGYDANETRANRAAQRKLHKCCQPGAHQ